MILKINKGKVEKKIQRKPEPRNYIQIGMVRSIFYKDSKGKTQIKREIVS